MNNKRAAVNVGAVEARAQAATAGPWVMTREELDADFSDEEQDAAFPMTIGPILSWEHVLSSLTDENVDQVEADAAFIAAARADVPALCAALREQDEEIVEAHRQRDVLAQAIADAAQKAGIYNGEVALRGSDLIQIVNDMAGAIEHRYAEIAHLRTALAMVSATLSTSTDPRSSQLMAAIDIVLGKATS